MVRTMRVWICGPDYEQPNYWIRAHPEPAKSDYESEHIFEISDSLYQKYKEAWELVGQVDSELREFLLNAKTSRAVY